MATVQILSRDIIKPSSPTPQHLHCYNLSLTDQLSAFCHVTFVIFYSNVPSSLESLIQTLKNSLSETLTDFYILAGRLKPDSTIHCTDDGVDLFVSRVRQSSISQLMNQPDARLISKLLPCNRACAQAPDGSGGRLLALQINLFECTDGGDMAIGVCISHKVADGLSLMNFLNSWAASARGEVQWPRPLLDGVVHYPPIKLGLVMNPVEHHEKLVLKRYVFDPTTIAKLQASSESLPEGSLPPRPTRVEVVTAAIWRRLVWARAKLGPPEMRMAAVHLVDMRRRVSPPLPPRSFGNHCALMKPWTATTPAAEMPELEARLRAVVRKVDNVFIEGFRGEGGFARVMETFGEALAAAGSGEVERYYFSSWCRFPMEEVNFGWGMPVWMAAGDVFFERGVLLMDRTLDGGIEAWVTTTEEMAAELQRDEVLLSFAAAAPAVAGDA